MKNHLLRAAALLALAFVFGPHLAHAALPGGKARFSVCFGKFDPNDVTTWVRMGRWNFDANGNVSAYFWQWDSTTGPYGQRGKAALNAHTCTMDGLTKSCNTYTPYGWISPALQYFQWSGTYTYNTGTGLLSINWTVGATASENWTVTLPEAGTARVVFNAGSSNYGITHGRGYGSNASWGTFTNVQSVPRVVYRQIFVIATYGKDPNTGNFVHIVDPGTAGTFLDSSTSPTDDIGPADLSGLTSASSGIALHMWSSASSRVCTPGAGCTGTRPGIVYHLGGTNTDRAMAWSHWCACLSPTDWPCFSGQLHPYAMDQIIADDGTFRGMVGIEAQDEPGSVGYQYQLKDFTLLP